MADKLTRELTTALARAAAEPAGLPLYAAKGDAGLFAATAAAKAAAQKALDDGYLRSLGTDPRSRRELYTASEAGLAYLFAQSNPRDLLNDFVRALEARQAQIDDLIATARGIRASLDGLKSVVASALGGPEPNDETGDIIAVVRRWHESDAADDCPLPELYRRLTESRPDCSVGRFHDALRKLHDAGRVYLHPWTGPLYALPEPTFALLVGHEIAYYASPRGESAALAKVA